jgi:acyl-CoA synthetase (AMP-forming)/AMP-acid ligase II
MLIVVEEKVLGAKNKKAKRRHAKSKDNISYVVSIDFCGRGCLTVLPLDHFNPHAEDQMCESRLGYKHSKTIWGCEQQTGAPRNPAHFNVPKDIVFAEALPKNPSGKLLKRELRREHAELFA